MQDKIYLLYFIGNLHNGGGQRQLCLRLKYLDRDRYHVRVACLRGKENSEKYAKKIEALGIGVDFLAVENIPNFRQRVMVLKDYITREKPDIVDSYLHFAYTTANLAARLAKVPLIFTFLDSLPNPKMKQNQPFEYRLAMRAVKDYCDFVIACSQPVKDAYVKAAQLDPRKVVVLTNTVDVSYWPSRLPVAERPAFLGLKEGELAVGCVGRLVPQKGVLDFVAAAKIVNQTLPNTHFFLVGDGILKNEVEKSVEALGIKQNFHIFADMIDLREFYSGLDVYAMASLWEGLPLSLLEAMSCKVPVVVTDVGGNTEVIKNGENGYLVKPEQPEALAERIVELLQQKHLAHKFVQNAYETVRRNFDQKNRANELAALYEEHLPFGVPRQKPTRGLILRACSWEAFSKIYHDVQKRWPWLELFVLTQNDTEAKLVDTFQFSAEKIICYGKGKLTFKRLDLSLIKHLRQLHPQITIIGYNNLVRKGYWRWEWIVFLIGCEKIVAYKAWPNSDVEVWIGPGYRKNSLTRIWLLLRGLTLRLSDYLTVWMGSFISHRRKKNQQWN